MASTTCQKCGAQNEADAPSCPKCGTPTSPASASNPARKSSFTTIALILICVMAGGLFAAWKLNQQASPVSTAQPVENVNLEDVRAKAERGEAEAQYRLGKIYGKGQGLPQSYADAAKWYRLAADQGNPAAQTALGELHEAGQGAPQDDAQAAQCYRRAAEQGYAPGQYSLAVLYVVGKGVPQDNTEALKWYRLAAEQGDALAEFNLGMRYTEGKGVTPDPVEAYKWLSLAAAQGISDAAPVRDGLKSRMTRDQIAEGRKRAEAFVPRKTATSAP